MTDKKDDPEVTTPAMTTEKTFAEDVAYIGKYFKTIVLENTDGAKLALSAELQGRVMTSTATGDDGNSYGYLNYEVLKSKQEDPQININGGEDRIWLSPEGGQYSIFFEPGVEMAFENWRTPKEFDSIPYEVTQQSSDSATFSIAMSLRNMSRFTFDCQLDRKVSLLSKRSIEEILGCPLGDLSAVAHECQNRLTNKSDTQWKQSTGLLGLWTLCMSKPSPNAIMIVPFKKGPVSELGTIVNADYFGKLDSSRLAISEELGLVILRGDGDFRSKLGMTFQRAEPRLASWDPDKGLLTIVEFNLPANAPDGYTNNLWEYQSDPFGGDVVNAYNDGPNESGGKLGGFYELETVSPALALAPSQSFTHIVRTFRIEGEREKLNPISHSVFGAPLEQIEGLLDSLK